MKSTGLTLKQANKLGDKLYQKYGKPLEQDHWGDYLAIAKDGKTVIGKDLQKVAKKAFETLGPASFLYKVGEIAVYKWRKVKE